MIKQYVGARYVPKFYENSLNPLSNEWEENVNYEALTVVTYLSDSYTSKKPVPVTVGNPRNNPEYWSLTGAYNAQVEEYRQEALAAANKADLVDLKVGDLDVLETSDKTSIVNAINELVTPIEENKRYIVIADSYSMIVGGVTPFTSKLKTKLNASETDYYVVGGSGMGYVRGINGNGNNALQELTAQSASIANHDTITDIISTVGLNDVISTDQTHATLVNNVANFIAYCKLTYPNAKIHLAMVGNKCDKNLTQKMRYMDIIDFIQKAALNNINIDLVKNVEYIMHARFLTQDYVHPNDEGSTEIANAIFKHLNGEHYSFSGSHITNCVGDDDSVIQLFESWDDGNYQGILTLGTANVTYTLEQASFMFSNAGCTTYLIGDGGAVSVLIANGAITYRRAAQMTGAGSISSCYIASPTLAMN